MADKLLPCPFCGGEARTRYIRDGRQALCHKCGAEGPPQFHGPRDIPTADARAITSWNERATDRAIAWLMGEGPDENGFWFGDEDAPDTPEGIGRYWWRSKFRKLIGQGLKYDKATRTIVADSVNASSTTETKP